MVNFRCVLLVLKQDDSKMLARLRWMRIRCSPQYQAQQIGH